MNRTEERRVRRSGFGGNRHESSDTCAAVSLVKTEAVEKQMIHCAFRKMWNLYPEKEFGDHIRHIIYIYIYRTTIQTLADIHYVGRCQQDTTHTPRDETNKPSILK